MTSIHPSVLAGREPDQSPSNRPPTRAESLARVSARLNAQLTIPAIVDIVCAEVVRALDVPAASINLWDEQHAALLFAGMFGLEPESARRMRPLAPTLYDEWGARTGAVSVVQDIQSAGGMPNADLLSQMHIRSMATARMIRDGRLVGSLHAYGGDEIRAFDAGELALLQAIGDQASQAINAARLYVQATRSLALAQTLHTVDVAITSSHDLRVILNVCIQQLTTFLQADAADVRLLNPHTLALEFTAGRGFHTPALQRLSPRLGEGPAGMVALHRNVLKIPDVRQEAITQTPVLAAEGFVSYVALPLIAKGQVNGVLEVYQRSRLDPDSDWLDYLQTLARQAAIAIDNALLFDRLQRTNVELALAYDESIEGWACALDLRDHEPEGHTARVAALTLSLGKALGVQGDELVHMRRGALLHDIGNFAVPEHILLKPGPLDEEERAIVKRHPQHAYDLLWPFGHLRRAIDIPHCHHERWDGSGYPAGLQGEQIPLGARIFAVAEVWDILRSDRPYRHAWSDAQAWKHILSASGTHFDPHIVDAFRNLSSTGMLPPRE